MKPKKPELKRKNIKPTIGRPKKGMADGGEKKGGKGCK